MIAPTRPRADTREQGGSETNVETVRTPKSTTTIGPFRRSTKLRRMALLFATGQPVHRRIAEEHGDHVLPNTVLELERKGVMIDRRPIHLAGYGGAKVTFTEYRVTGDNLRALRQALGLDR